LIGGDASEVWFVASAELFLVFVLAGVSESINKKQNGKIDASLFEN